MLKYNLEEKKYNFLIFISYFVGCDAPAPDLRKALAVSYSCSVYFSVSSHFVNNLCKINSK